MTAVALSPIFNGFQGFSIAGLPLSGGLINTYLAGTSTPAGTYTDSLGTVLNANPIQLDGAGLPPNEIWLVQGTAYKFVLTDSLGLNPRTFDNVTPEGSGFLATALLASTGSGLVGYSATTIYPTNTIGRYLVDRIRETGTRCLAIGLLAGAALTAGATDVVAIGPSAGSSITTAFGHVLIGTNAGKAITTPAYCVAVGPYALEVFNDTGNVNALHTALGAYALSKAVTGAQYDTAVGAYAGMNTTTGYFLTFLGQGAGRDNTIGFSNTYGGHSAGLVMTGASNFNTLFGDNCAFSTTLASGITAVGFQPLANNTTGNSYTVAMGYSPLAQSNSVDPSVAIGQQAGYTLTTAGKAVIVGTLAYLLGQGAQTTAVGHESMGQETSTGTNNSAFGYRSGYTSTNALSNTTCLGANTAATRSNQVMVGDLNVVEVRTAGCLIQRLFVTGSTPMDNNLEFAFYLVDNTHVNFKLKGSDATVRFATGAFGGGGFVLA